MRDQYAGDVSDVLKFGLLRVLAGNDRTLGVAWYYVPGHDGRPDGKHLEWRNEPAWQRFDPVLHAGLSELSERSVAKLERADIWPTGTLFHRERMPERSQRGAWAVSMRDALGAAEMVFLDPDNGIGKESAKHATLSEIKLLRKPGRAIVFITFPGHNKKHDVLINDLHDRLRSEASAQNVASLRTTISVPRGDGSPYFVPRQRWFTIVDPDDALIARAEQFANALAAVPRASARLDIIN